MQLKKILKLSVAKTKVMVTDLWICKLCLYPGKGYGGGGDIKEPGGEDKTYTFFKSWS